MSVGAILRKSYGEKLNGGGMRIKFYHLYKVVESSNFNRPAKAPAANRAGPGQWGLKA